MFLLVLAGVVGAPAPAAAAPEGVPCTPEPTDMTIGYGDLVTCAIDVPGDVDLFRFSGAAGERAVISLSGRAFVGEPRSCWRLRGPDATVIASACANSITGWALPVSGLYTIEVYENGNDQAIAYNLALDRSGPPPPTASPIPFGVTMSAAIDPAGDLDGFVFEGGASDVVSISLSGRAFVGEPRACLVLVGPDVAVVHSFCANAVETVTLPLTGTYTIFVDESGNDQAIAYNLVIQCLSGPTCGLLSGAQPAEPVACHTTISNGAGDQLLRFCVSDRGNLVQFESPAGAEHLRVGAHGEGYAVCSATGAHGYDVGYAWVGFGPPTIVQPKGPNTLPLTVTRRTLDGAIEVKQTFARDTKEKDVTITMVVKNVSGGPLSGVQLTRYFDGDIDGTQGDDTYGRTVDSVWGWQTPAGNGLMLTAGTFNIDHETGVETFWQWHPGAGGGAGAAVCGPGHAPGAPGDLVGRVNYSIGDLGPGKSKTVKFIYRRF